MSNSSGIRLIRSKSSGSRSRFSKSCKCRKSAPQTIPTSAKIRERCQPLVLSEETLKEVANLFLEQVKKGLSRKTHDTAAVKCYVTYVQDLPRGDENGKYLGIDFASKDVQLVLCNITDDGVELKTKTYTVPEHTLYSTGAQLFDNIVHQLAKFMLEEQLTREKRFLAITFGFPLLQRGLERGFLIKWTKDFKCSDVVGNDVVQLLKDAIERQGTIDVEVCAIVNDTTDALISCAYDHCNCRIAVRICVGSNACYEERQENAELFDDENKGSGTVLINTEWGAFGDDGVLNFIKTDYDREADESSVNIGKQTFEKMVSSLYMGELVRLIMVHLTRDGLLFKGKSTPQLYTCESFSTDYVYLIEEDPPGNYTNCREVLTHLGFKNIADDDCVNVRYICECVSRRSASLVAAALSALIHKINQPYIGVGIEGTLYDKHPHYHNILSTTLVKLVKRSIRCYIIAATEKRGRGAALLAAALSRRYKPHV